MKAASAVAATSPTASAALTTRARRGSTKNRRDLMCLRTATSRRFTMIITLSTAILRRRPLSGIGELALAKTAAIPTQAFGLAMPECSSPERKAFGLRYAFESVLRGRDVYASHGFHAA